MVGRRLKSGLRPVVLTTYLRSGARHPHLGRRRGSSIVVSHPETRRHSPLEHLIETRSPLFGPTAIRPTPVPL